MAFVGSKCPRSVLGVLTAIVDSRSEWRAFEARGGEKNKKKVELSVALRSREV